MKYSFFFLRERACSEMLIESHNSEDMKNLYMLRFWLLKVVKKGRYTYFTEKVGSGKVKNSDFRPLDLKSRRRFLLPTFNTNGVLHCFEQLQNRISFPTWINHYVDK